MRKYSETSFEPIKSSMLQFFPNIINSWKSLNIFAKISILDAWLSSEYVSNSPCQRLKYFGQKHEINSLIGKEKTQYCQILTHFNLVVHFYIFWKCQKTFGMEKEVLKWSNGLKWFKKAKLQILSQFPLVRGGKWLIRFFFFFIVLYSVNWSSSFLWVIQR